MDKATTYPNRCPEWICYLYGQTDNPYQQLQRQVAKMCSSAELEKWPVLGGSIHTGTLHSKKCTSLLWINVSIEMHEEKCLVSKRCWCKSMHSHLSETHTVCTARVDFTRGNRAGANWFGCYRPAYPRILLQECVRYCSRTSPYVDGIRCLTERERQTWRET